MKQLYAAADVIENAAIATKGNDLFIETMPSDLDYAVMLQCPPGGEKIDRGQEGFFNSYFTVIVRDPDVSIAYQKCLDICEALKIEHEQQGDVYFVSMWPRQRPSVYPRGDSDLVEVSAEIHCAFALTNA